MNLLIIDIVLLWFIAGLGCWIGFQLIRQKERIRVRLEAMGK